MAEKISLEKLTALMADSNTPPSELRKYFILDEAGSGPFSPRVAINPQTVKIPSTPEGQARSEAAMTFANGWARHRRWVEFHRRISEGHDGPIIVSEGDSWFQFPLLVDEVIDHLSSKYPIRSLDAAGDTLDKMARQREYMDVIAETKASVFLISAGGNDALGGGDIKRHLRKFDSTLLAADYLQVSFGRLLDRAIGLYDGIFREVERAFPELPVICHGYDYAIPAGGRWLGAPMLELGIKKPELQAAIVVEMVNRFNTALLRLTQGYPNVTYVDVRGTVTAGHWYDELHPSSQAFGLIAKKIDQAIQTVAKAPKAMPETAVRSVPKQRPGGEAFRFSSVSRQPNALLAAPVKLAPPKRKGISLHIGVNSVDPEHYAGWSGPLAACEFDAEDMDALADGLGYATKKLLTKDATRERVIKEIKAAAKKLKAGDIFLLTYSGHGSQVPDLNRDEPQGDHGLPDNLDETWCLYDAQLLDDELYMMWTEFAPDVRIVVISDSCHSGSVVKHIEQDLALTSAAGPLQPNEPGVPRAMPYRVAARVFRQNRAFYEKLGSSLERVEYKIVSKELTHPLACTVRLVSGCQDNQYSYDGMVNGEFTGKLLATWAQGQFVGSYKTFYHQILNQMDKRQTPNHWVIGVPNPAFDAQRPFEI